MRFENHPAPSGSRAGLALTEQDNRVDPRIETGDPLSPPSGVSGSETPAAVLPPTVRQQDVVEQLNQICRHRLFASAPNLQRFLRFTVEAALQGEVQHLKEYTIAVSVFGRRPDFDPRTASIVRTQAGKLRSRLKDYYRSEPSNRPVYIVFRPGSYVPSFEAFEPSDDAPGLSATGSSSFGPAKGSAPLGILPLMIPPDDPAMRALADLFESTLYTHFAAEPRIQLIPRTSIAAVVHKSMDARQICAHLNTRWLIEGTILRGDSVSVNLHLIGGAEGSTRWAKTVSFPMEEMERSIAVLAEQLVLEIAREITSSAGQPIRRSVQISSDVRRFCEEGHHFCDRLTESSLQVAADRFWRALSHESDYSVAHAGLSRCQVHRAWLELASMPELWPAAKSAALRAVSCNPDEAGSQAAMAAVHCVFEWNWQLGASGYARALRLAPDDPQIMASYALFALIPSGALDEARQLIDRAVDLAPVNTFTRFSLAWCQYLRKEYASAASTILHLHEFHPPSALTTGTLIRAQILMGDARAAAETLTTAAHRDSLSPRIQSLLACSHASAGRAGDARQILLHLTSEDNRSYVPALYPAMIHHFLGDHREALLYLERSVRERAFGCLWLKTDPLWDDLRETERFSLLIDNLAQ